MGDIEIQLTLDRGGTSTDFDDIISDSKESGVTVSVKEVKDEGAVASIGWLIGGAVVVYFGRPFVKKFAETLGERAGNATADALGNLSRWLHRKCFGAKPQFSEIRWKMGRNGEREIIESPFSNALRYAFDMERRQRNHAMLIFREEISEDSLNRAAHMFLRLETDYYYNTETSPLTDWVRIPLFSALNVILTLNEEEDELVLVDVVNSEKLNQLVTCALDNAKNYVP